MTLVDAHMLGLVGQTPVGPADPVLRKGLALNRKQPLHQEVDCSHSVGTTLMQPLNELLLELHSTVMEFWTVATTSWRPRHRQRRNGTSSRQIFRAHVQRLLPECVKDSYQNVPGQCLGQT